MLSRYLWLFCLLAVIPVHAADQLDDQDAIAWRKEKVSELMRLHSESLMIQKNFNDRLKAGSDGTRQGMESGARAAEEYKFRDLELGQRLASFVESTNLDASKRFKDNPYCRSQIEGYRPILEALKKKERGGIGAVQGYQPVILFCAIPQKAGEAFESLKKVPPSEKRTSPSE